MFIELFAFMLIMLSGTYLYKTLAVYGMILVIYSLLLIIVYLVIHRTGSCSDVTGYTLTAEILKSNSKNEQVLSRIYTDIIRGPNMTGIGILWIAWLTYGVLLKDVDLGESDHDVSHLQSIMIICLVAGTYMRDVQEKAHLLALLASFYTVVIFVPHKDALAYDMSSILIVIKLAAFLAIYCSSSLILFTGRVQPRVTSKPLVMQGELVEEKVILDEELSCNQDDQNFNKRDYTIFKEWVGLFVQSSWVLFCSRYTLVAVVFQVIVYMPSIIVSYNSYCKMLKLTRKGIATAKKIANDRVTYDTNVEVVIPIEVNEKKINTNKTRQGEDSQERQKYQHRLALEYAPIEEGQPSTKPHTKKSKHQPNQEEGSTLIRDSNSSKWIRNDERQAKNPTTKPFKNDNGKPHRHGSLKPPDIIQTKTLSQDQLRKAISEFYED